MEHALKRVPTEPQPQRSRGSLPKRGEQRSHCHDDEGQAPDQIEDHYGLWECGEGVTDEARSLCVGGGRILLNIGAFIRAFPWQDGAAVVSADHTVSEVEAWVAEEGINTLGADSAAMRGLYSAHLTVFRQ